MNGTFRPELFDRITAPASGDSLRVIHTDYTDPRPLIWGRRDDGRIFRIPLTDSFDTEWQPDDRHELAVSDPARILGCLLGGAVGDALGAAVEFSDWATIQKQFGPAGIRQMVPAYGRVGAITDDTQMMLFTAEGLIRATVRGEARGICDMASVVHHALLRWLATQHVPASTKVGMDGWLITESELWSRRAPGNTCLSALSQSSRFGEFAVNASKGCGGVMRVAACAFFANPFELGSETARLSHGHPTGYLAAGLFADILKLIWREDLSLHKACVESLARHGDLPGMEETRQLVESVLELHAQGIRPTPSAIERLGGGWIAEEALAIGLWCALSAENLEEGVVLAVNHSGDSDSTGLIAGNLLGLIHGPSAIPGDWLSQLELRQVITQIAADITFVPHCYDPDDSTDAGSAIWLRYPGW